MAGSNVATPLYAIYEREFGFSKAVLTLVFATYALVLAPSLLVFGQLSDRMGRRRVLAAGFATATVGLVLFAVARQPAVAVRGARRAGPGGRDDQRRGGRRAGRARPGAERGPRRRCSPRSRRRAAARPGRCVAGMLAQWAPARLVLPFALFAASGSSRRSPRWRSTSPGASSAGRITIVRPSVPPEIRGLFARVSLTGAAVWAVAALFLSVVPSYAAELLDTSNLALLGAVSAAHARRVLRRADRRAAPSAHARMQADGLVLLAAGLLALVARLPDPLAARPAARGPARRRRPRPRLPRRPGPAQPRRAARPPRRGQRGVLHADLPRRGDRGRLDRAADAALRALDRGDAFAIVVGRSRSSPPSGTSGTRAARSSSPCAAAITVLATPVHE